MKKIILTGINILALVIVLSIGSASAEKRHIVIEMGESGQTISFLMTSEEIADHEADIERLVQIGTSISQTIAPRFINFEIGESGQIVSFPMTPEEIAADDAASQHLSDIRKKSIVDDKQTVAYEMAESGILLEFQKRDIEVIPAGIATLKYP
jgi:hypothetical protein